MAKAQGLDPYKYYVKVLEALLHCTRAIDYERLLPWNADLDASNLVEKVA